MTNPAPDYEEMAALYALGLLDEAATRELLDAADRDPKVRRLVDACDETAAQVALSAPEISPPACLRQAILDALPPAPGKIVRFSPWPAYAIAACLAGLCLFQAASILGLRTDYKALAGQLQRARDDADQLRNSNRLITLRLEALDAKDPTYASAKILVAWDGTDHRGTVKVENLPPVPPGHDYQLWILDPNAATPVSAGVLAVSRPFDSKKVSVPNPGFAISLEPTGGSPSPTGPILFAVAPAE